jgi:hypothetical protein
MRRAIRLKRIADHFTFSGKAFLRSFPYFGSKNRKRTILILENEPILGLKMQKAGVILGKKLKKV